MQATCTVTAVSVINIMERLFYDKAVQSCVKESFCTYLFKAGSMTRLSETISVTCYILKLTCTFIEMVSLLVNKTATK